LKRGANLLPGILLCLAITGGAMLLARAEADFGGSVWLEPLVLAILLGTLVRTIWEPGPRWRPGSAFCGKTLLEIAIVLLGASVSAKAVAASGFALLIGIAAAVDLAILGGVLIGRLLGLPRRMGILVACGNAICGNSAIVAVAPVIGADAGEVAAAIAFTAVLGVAVVLSLPLIALRLHLSTMQSGVFAGLVVYAVPQVLAATAPLGPAAVQIGTLVKLVRVLMLGPVILMLSLIAGRRPGGARISASRLVPWFILGFLAMAALRSLGALPEAILPPMAQVSTFFTVVSMAALGLATDLRAVARAGPRVTAAVTFSLLLLGAISLRLIHLIGMK
jgi:uncharacterized integral membrane protein (TIGR00698 family)